MARSSQSGAAEVAVYREDDVVAAAMLDVGALRLRLAAGGVDVSAWRDERRRYWQAAR